MADGIIYKDAIVITTIKKMDDSFVLDLPFQIFGQDIVQNGAMVTYALEKLEGQEVMAKVDYRSEDEAIVKKFAGILANPKASAKYTEHYDVKDAENKKVDFCQSLVLKI